MPRRSTIISLVALGVVVLFVFAMQGAGLFRADQGTSAPASPSGSAAVPATETQAAGPIALPDSTLNEGVNACISPYSGELVSKYDGICDANLQIYQCYCRDGAGCDFDRTPGRERGTCTTPGAVHPVLAH